MFFVVRNRNFNFATMEFQLVCLKIINEKPSKKLILLGFPLVKKRLKFKKSYYIKLNWEIFRHFSYKHFIFCVIKSAGKRVKWILATYWTSAIEGRESFPVYITPTSITNLKLLKPFKFIWSCISTTLVIINYQLPTLPFSVLPIFTYFIVNM